MVSNRACVVGVAAIVAVSVLPPADSQESTPRVIEGSALVLRDASGRVRWEISATKTPGYEGPHLVLRRPDGSVACRIGTRPEGTAVELLGTGPEDVRAQLRLGHSLRQANLSLFSAQNRLTASVSSDTNSTHLVLSTPDGSRDVQVAADQAPETRTSLSFNQDGRRLVELAEDPADVPYLKLSKGQKVRVVEVE